MMIEQIRKPLFLIAFGLIAVAVLVEIGSLAFVDVKGDDAAKALQSMGADAPGYGIPYLALLDGLLLFTVGLIGAGLIVPESIQARAQGMVTLVVTLLILLGSLALILHAIVKLAIMLGLFFAPPFGTLAYLALYGHFNTTAARVTLTLIMLLKCGFALFLLFAHQRFLQNKGLVLIILTSLLGTIIVSFLHGFLPLVMCSIMDVLAAIVVAVIAAIWAIFFLAGSINSVIKAVH
jgi:hypothetical protein